MSYYTYILYSKKINIFYKGSTSNVFERIKRHNAGRENYTKKGIPWILLWFADKPSRAEAYRFELKLKNLSRKRTIELMLKYSEGFARTDELLLVKQLSEC